MNNTISNQFALETRGVIKEYQAEAGTIFAVDDVSLTVAAGEFVALVGPSGSGKTTMLSMLAALLKPSSGQILLDGIDLAGMSDAERVKLRREKIGFTFQANNLVPYLSAVENVELMLHLNRRLDKTGRLRAKELLARLGLAERMNNLPGAALGWSAAAGGYCPCPYSQSEPGAGRRTHGQPGYRACLPGGRNLRGIDTRAKTRRHHGHTRFAHGSVCGPRAADEGW
jgi:ABC-type antimicrobial peptide transport system, ATPase component